MSHPLYEVSDGLPRDCFPVGFDRTNLENISRICDMWCKYIDVQTGELVDCAEFAKHMEELDMRDSRG
jgi:hypothetical protein